MFQRDGFFDTISEPLSQAPHDDTVLVLFFPRLRCTCDILFPRGVCAWQFVLWDLQGRTWDHVMQRPSPMHCTTECSMQRSVSAATGVHGHGRAC